MISAKEKIKSIIEELPEECTFEDVQYHLYVAEKITKGINRAETEGTLSQEDVERKFNKWITQ